MQFKVEGFSLPGIEAIVAVEYWALGFLEKPKNFVPARKESRLPRQTNRQARQMPLMKQNNGLPVLGGSGGLSK